MLLAVLAGVMDAVPIFGVPVATIPAVLAGLTVSVPTAVGVLALYVAYQQVENYLLVPRIYGRTLHVSPFSILVGVLVGGELLGVIGILLALPITAAIPIIVRIWREEETEPVASPAQLAPSNGVTAQDERART
jgi:predicted PurR-regulated permease PerM